MKQTGRMLFCVLALLAPMASWAVLTDFDGAPKRLTDYTGHGKWTIVMFWASDCHVCNAEAEQYIQFHESHKQRNASVLGISLDGNARLDAARNFIKRHDVTFPNLIGEPEAVADMYQELTRDYWVGTPTFLVFDPQGNLKAAQPGAVPAELIESFIKQHSPGADKQ